MNFTASSDEITATTGSLSSTQRRIESRPLLVRLACGALCLLVGSGCGQSDEVEVQTRPFEGRSIEVLVPEDFGFPDRWQPVIDEWSEQTGATATLTTFPSSAIGATADGMQKFADRLEQDGASGSPPALLLVPLTTVPALVDRGLLAELPTRDSAADAALWPDLYEGLRENVASWNQLPITVPLSSPVLLCYARIDLLEKAGLEPPTTWTEYQRLLETLDEWAPGLTAAEPWDESYAATLFLARAAALARHSANLSFYFDFRSGQSLISTEGFVQALELATRAVRELPEESLNWSPARCRREILEGRAALAIAMETGPANRPLPFGPDDGTKPEAAPDSDRADGIELSIRRLPGSAATWNYATNVWTTHPPRQPYRVDVTAFAGLSAAISRKVSQEEADVAWNLLQTLTSRGPGAMPPGTASLCRISQQSSRAEWVGRELTGREASEAVDAISTALNDTGVVPELPVVGRDRFRASLTKHVLRCLRDEATPQEALDAVAEEWEAIRNELGPLRVLNSYRRSIGLPAITADESSP